MIPQDVNLIAYEYYKNQFTPNEVYPSGQKDEQSLIDKYRTNLGDEDLAVLVLEDDIVNSFGFGLKKGFYNVIPDKYYDFLLIYQTGILKAKIPVVKMETFETLNPKQEKIKRLSYKSYLKQQEKEYRKHLKGLSEEEVNYKKAEIHYIADKNAYIIIYNNDNIELTGMVKLK